MRNTFFAALLGLSLVGAPFLVGCDNGPDTKAAHEKTVETTKPDGTKSVDKEKSTTDANGNVHTEKVHENK